MSASFVFFFTCQFVDSNVPQIRKCYEDGYRMVNLESCATYVSHANGETTVREQSVINEEQAEIVREYGGGKIMYVSDAEYLHFFTSEYLTENPWEYGYAKPTTRYQMSAAANPYEVVELDPETGMEDALLTPDSRFLDPSLCSLPQTFTEVAITDLTFDGFKIFGYTDDDGINYEIKTPDDIIGKKLGEYTVCGVFSTEVSLDEYRERLDVPYDATYSDGIGRGKTIFFDIFVKSGWRESISGVFLFSHLNGFMIKLSGDLNKDKQLLEDLRFPWNWNDSALVYNMDMKIVSRYYKYIDKADVLWNDFVVNASRILGCVMAVVAFLLLFTFFSVNFDARGKEMEVLSALGASSRDIAKINVTESFYVASMIFALTMIGVFVYCAAFSSWAMIEIFYVGLMQWLMGIGICYIIPMIAVGVFLLIRSRKTARR